MEERIQGRHIKRASKSKKQDNIKGLTQKKYIKNLIIGV